MRSKTNGHLTRHYRESDGAIMSAYSYDTCILARMAPSEDFPEGRLVLNETQYSNTSIQHYYKLVRELDTAEYDNRAILINLGYRHTPESLIRAVEEMIQSVTQCDADVYVVEETHTRSQT